MTDNRTIWYTPPELNPDNTEYLAFPLIGGVLHIPKAWGYAKLAEDGTYYYLTKLERLDMGSGLVADDQGTTTGPANPPTGADRGLGK